MKGPFAVTIGISLPVRTSYFQKPVPKRHKLWLCGACFWIHNVHRQTMRHKAKGRHESSRRDVISDERLRTNRHPETRGCCLEQKVKRLETLPSGGINSRHPIYAQPVMPGVFAGVSMQQDVLV